MNFEKVLYIIRRQTLKSILQAAVQGKLVPQNAHDDPATELLKCIQQEKAQLVKESKIKKAKPLPAHHGR